MTRQEASKIVATLAAIYDVPAWQPERLRAFAAALGDLEYGPASAAVQEWIGTRKERPQPSDIRSACSHQLAVAGAIPEEFEPDQAWGQVTRAMSRVGRYRPFPAPPGSVLGDVVERMGWETLCISDNPEADRAHFLQLYRQALSRRHSERNAAPGLQLPNDTARLEAASRATVDRKATLELPSPAEQDSVRQQLRDLKEDLGRKTNRPSILKVMREPEPVEHRIPTDAELRAAADRRRQLLAQAGTIAGTPEIRRAS